jgi:hypothetical protein
MEIYEHSPQFSTKQKPPSLSERLCAKALVAAYHDKNWQRYISFARVAARREEVEAAERTRREEIQRAVERAYDTRRRAARI